MASKKEATQAAMRAAARGADPSAIAGAVPTAAAAPERRKAAPTGHKSRRASPSAMVERSIPVTIKLPPSLWGELLQRAGERKLEGDSSGASGIIKRALEAHRRSW